MIYRGIHFPDCLSFGRSQVGRRTLLGDRLAVTVQRGDRKETVQLEVGRPPG